MPDIERNGQKKLTWTGTHTKTGIVIEWRPLQPAPAPYTRRAEADMAELGQADPYPLIQLAIIPDANLTYRRLKFRSFFMYSPVRADFIRKLSYREYEYISHSDQTAPAAEILTLNTTPDHHRTPHPGFQLSVYHLQAQAIWNPFMDLQRNLKRIYPSLGSRISGRREIPEKNDLLCLGIESESKTGESANRGRTYSDTC